MPWKHPNIYLWGYAYQARVAVEIAESVDRDVRSYWPIEFAGGVGISLGGGSAEYVLDQRTNLYGREPFLIRREKWRKNYRLIPSAHDIIRKGFDPVRNRTGAHHLVIDSLHDAMAHCSAGDWRLIRTGAESKMDIELDFRKHLGSVRTNPGVPCDRRDINPRRPPMMKSLAEKFSAKIEDDEYLELMDIDEEAHDDDIPGLLESNIVFLIEREMTAWSKPSIVVHDWELLGKDESRTTDTILGTYSVSFGDDSQYDGNFVADGMSTERGFILNQINVGSNKLSYFG